MEEAAADTHTDKAKQDHRWEMFGSIQQLAHFHSILLHQRVWQDIINKGYITLDDPSGLKWQ